MEEDSATRFFGRPQSNKGPLGALFSHCCNQRLKSLTMTVNTPVPDSLEDPSGRSSMLHVAADKD